jgi:magnesium chelatase family protein
MKVQSLVKWGLGFRKIEVEVSLAPGLPTMQILGQPDKVIRESAWRIRSAFDHQGFVWPSSRQILVNLKPSHIKKVSSGLDLAIASALLWETGQVPKPEEECPVLYGELGLTGDVICPEGFQDYQCGYSDMGSVYTGRASSGLAVNTLQIAQLSSLGSPERKASDLSTQKMMRPDVGEYSFASSLSRIMAIVALGEHSAFFAGPAGTGKTTVAHTIWSLLEAPSPQEILVMKQIARRFGQTLSWRPFVNPHHTMPPLSLIGGGNSPRPGEITRAHGGVLLFDELLEFHPKVLEGLREPIEAGSISISRGSEVEIYPSRFLFLATTNLCRCGEYVPNRWNRCRCSEKARLAYQDKLSGPLLDRIAIKVLSNQWEVDRVQVPVSKILERLLAARNFIQSRRGQVKKNSELSLREIEPMLTEASRFGSMQGFVGSQRRYMQWLQVARSVADLEGSEVIEPRHLEESRVLVTLHIQPGAQSKPILHVDSV